MVYFLYLWVGFFFVIHTQFSSVAQLCQTLWDPMECSTTGLPVITNTQSLLKLIIESVMPPSHRILCRPLLLLPSIFPSNRVFPNESALPIRWPKYWSLSFKISPSNEHQDWSPLEWTGWISLQSKGLSRAFSTPQFKNINSSVLSFLYSPTLTSIHDYPKNHSFD